jgi:Na+-transporting NADH:ubiquinone oxidoreductase subunit C
VSLKPVQMENRQLDKQRSILSIAGLGGAGDVGARGQGALRQRIKARVVDLQTGEYTDAHDAQLFDPLKAARDPKLSEALAGRGRHRADQAPRALHHGLHGGEGRQARIADPADPRLRPVVHAARLRGLKGDLNTVVGLGFYQHAETPGLGGEVDNPKWKALWPGKQLFDEHGQARYPHRQGRRSIRPAPTRSTRSMVLAGATLTSNGVDRLLQFWLGEQGFGPYLAKLRTQGV